MQLSLVTIIAAAAGGAVASTPDITEEIRNSFHGAEALLMPRQNSQNLQTFTGALGGIKADPVTKSGNSQRPFEVGGDTFTDYASAAQRSCDNQKNNCAQAANSGKGTFSVSECDTQDTQCKANIQSSSASTSASASASASASPSPTTSGALVLASQNAQFNFFCEE